MTRVLFLLLVIFLESNQASAQTPVQTIRGIVIDHDSQLPLVGATIWISNADTSIGAITNAAGVFKLANIPTGRVDLKVSYLGYQEKTIPNVEVNSAKEVVLEIALTESLYKLETVTVTASEQRGSLLNDLAIVSARTVSAEQTSRFAGGFNDPSKITSNFAGVATSPDGGNEIIIRGNSPKYIQWRLEGSQISNPNHFGDQNTISGIVNTLNNNLITTSDFYTGAFPAEFGDALSGVYDIRMRKGNNQKFEGIFGLGLLGTDITLEGPYKKGYDGSFLVNYRYSTIGLANNLGLIKADGANINFQDAAFKFWLPSKNLGDFTIFGLMGKSNFKFEDVDPDIWVAPDEDFVQTEITEDYKKLAFLFNTGLNHTISLSSKSYLESSFIYSRNGIDDRVYEKPSANSNQRMNFNSDVAESTYRLSSVYNHKVNAKHKINAGLQFNLLQVSMQQRHFDKDNQQSSLIDFDESISSLQSFVNWKFQANDKITVVGGLHNTNVLYNNKYTLEPRVAISYGLTSFDILSFGYGNHSTMESVHNYFVGSVLPDGSYSSTNHDLGLLRANHFVLGYEKYLTKKLRFNLESYYQDLYNIPVENNPNSSYSTLNEGLALRYVDLVNEGTGKNYGVEFTFERFLNEGYYFLLNASLYESKYTALDQVERNTKYSGNYLVNLLAGKEFSGLGRKNNQTFSINTKVFFGGGRYYVPLLRDINGDLAVDTEKGMIYDDSKAFQNKLDDISNVVLSISHKWNLKNTTHELYLNIDNITNHRARLTEYYDASAADGIGNERQVGSVPNFLYRIYF